MLRRQATQCGALGSPLYWREPAASWSSAPGWRPGWKRGSPSRGRAWRASSITRLWQYLEDEERTAVAKVLAAAGARASSAAPLTWLRMEPGGDMADVRLHRWPQDVDTLVARAGYHGRPVHRLGDGDRVRR
ncbi:MAG: DUF2332 family protein [Actinomycetota bacterium]|nr:DUF2332 family protein [Actinomycetota bacterium]